MKVEADLRYSKLSRRKFMEYTINISPLLSGGLKPATAFHIGADLDWILRWPICKLGVSTVNYEKENNVMEEDVQLREVRPTKGVKSRSRRHHSSCFMLEITQQETTVKSNTIS